MKRYFFVAVLTALISALLLGGIAAGSMQAKPKHAVSVIRQAALGQLRPAHITVHVRRHGRVVSVQRKMPFFSAGTLAAAYGAIKGDELREEAADANSHEANPDVGISQGSVGCSKRLNQGKGDVRVNQDCTYRRQAEEENAYNPVDKNNIVAGQNDSRVGFNQCGFDFSTNNGTHWGDELPPFRQKVNNPAREEPTASDPNRHTILGGPGTLHTYDADSDPTLAMDALGRSFFGCVAFDVFSNASLIYGTQSPPGAEGSFYFNIGQFGRAFVIAEDNNSAVFHDKEFISADHFASSPNENNVYMTWTVFRFSPLCGPQPNPDQDERYCQSPIFGSMSTDGGVHWSTPEEISGVSSSLCFFGNFFQPGTNPNACNFDQGSDSIPLPNGDLEVIFNNGNTAAGNPNAQQLGVHCHPSGNSANGTAHLNCAAPAKVGNDVIVGEPLCNFGRGPEECIPGAFIRTNDYPRINGENVNDNTLYAVWQDYRNGEFDIQQSVSTDGGLTWTEQGTVNPDSGLDHYFPATDVSPKQEGNKSKVGVSYYRTERVPGENTTPALGFSPCPGVIPLFTPVVTTTCQPGVGAQNSDYVLAGGNDSNLPFAFKVVSPTFPPPNGIQAGFNGDYSGLVINQASVAHPIWSDTRNVDPYAPANGVVNDEDIFTDKVGLPNGKAKTGVGKIGRR